jgi:hypothetical protein
MDRVAEIFACSRIAGLENMAFISLKKIDMLTMKSLPSFDSSVFVNLEAGIDSLARHLKFQHVKGAI